jgi:hypothetical protein
MTSQDRAQLTTEVRNLLDSILSRLDFPEIEALREQLSRTTVVGGPITMLNLQVSDAIAAQLPDGPIPMSSIVLDKIGDEVGELLIWVDSGYLSTLEFSWWTDASPDRLPAIDQVRVSRK